MDSVETLFSSSATPLFVAMFLVKAELYCLIIPAATLIVPPEPFSQCVRLLTAGID